MAFVNHKTRELNAKIVYVGPAGSGKTTCLRCVAERTDAKHAGDLIRLERDNGRTAYFDFLPLFLGRIRGYRTRLHLYSIPGRIPFLSSRRMVLKGADAIVYVADSDPAKLQENIECWRGVREQLGLLGAEVATLPVVYQLNKRDLHNAVLEDELRRVLAPEGHPVFPSVATQGLGVFEALKAAGRLVLDPILAAK